MTIKQSMPKIPSRQRAWFETKPKDRDPNKNHWLYLTPYWKDIKKDFWNNAENQTCAHCSRPKLKGDKYWTVDHKEPVPVPCDFDTFRKHTENGNLQGLCPKCNHRKTAKDRRR